MNIAIVGNGNIAWHFAQFFHTHGHQITQIYSRTSANGQPLADAFSAQLVTSLSEINDHVDLLIIAVSDSAIESIIDQIDSNIRAIVVHTSGATSIDALQRFNRRGVIYPPQSISKNVDSNLSNIPFAIEGSSIQVQTILFDMISPIASKAFYANSEQRLALHLAAVFANNFSNALFQIAFDILQRQQLDFDLLKPIVLETAQKVQSQRPIDVQTGPAVRNDQETMNKHLQFLSKNEELSEIYQQLSNFIIKTRLND